MAEPTKFLVENEAISQGGGLGSMFDFSSGGSIFSVPSSILGGSDVTGFGTPTFLGGAGPTFGVPFTGSTLAGAGLGPGEMSFFQPSGQIAPGSAFIAPADFAVGGGNPFVTYGTAPLARIETGETGGVDMSGVTLAGQPYRNVGIDQTVVPVGAGGSDVITSTGAQTPTVTAGSDVVTTNAEGGGVTRLDPFVVSGTKIPGGTVNLSDIYTPGPTGGNALLGDVTSGATGGGAVVLPPYVVSSTKTAGPSISTEITPSSTPSGIAGYTDTGEAIMMDPVTVTATKSPLSTLTPEEQARLVEAGRTNFGLTPAVQLPPFVVTGKKDPGTGFNIKYDGDPNVPPPSTSVFIPPSTKSPFGPSTPPSTKTGGTLPSTPTATGTAPTSATPTTTTTSSAMTQRDIAAELAKTMPALQQYQGAIQKMYGDLYQQFMPKGISQTEQGLINQYQSDLARLQQRQAGMLSPEDVRQAQQSAREAYGARGQVMGPGAIGAELLNRESIRQQREDQARAGLQQSYGNILNMANIQTGNLFSPIASLMSGTFNPLGAYPADVYGTNVNAQLAREIAQKNYEAAVRSAELSGAAGKSASTTSAAGQIGAAALPYLLSSIFCWVAREVYGDNNPKWLKFRDWMFQHAPAWFFNFYLENGEKIAAWLKRHPWAKRPIRMWMDSRIRAMEKRELVLKEAV